MTQTSQHHYLVAAVEWLALLLRIPAVPGSISARRQAILNEVFHGFSQSL
jgi:hypothetical protein